MQSFGHLLLLVAGTAAVCSARYAEAERLNETLISREEASRHGLTRAWFAQVQLDRSRSRLVHLTHEGDMLLAQTDQAMVQAFDAETGRTLWISQIGRPNHPSNAPDANQDSVAVVNGSRLYLADRATGHLKWERALSGGPGAGPALTKTRVYIPMIDGKIESYELEHPKLPPWLYASYGRALVPPRFTGDSICWPTDVGFLYVGRSEDPMVRFRVETSDAIVTQPAFKKPYLFVASLDGYVYAVHELSRNQIWRFSCGDPISETPVVVEDRVYVCADRGGMYCISAETGEQIWWVPKVARFLAASQERVYATDLLSRILVLDAKTGARLSTIPIAELSLFLVNDRTDRIYVGTRTGLIQCLHDEALPEPLDHTAADQEKTANDKRPADEAKPKVEPKPADGDVFGDADGAEDAADADGADAVGNDPFGGDPFK